MAAQNVMGKDGERIKSFYGNRPALLNSIGIDPNTFPVLVTPGATCSAMGGDGLGWMLKSDYPFISASRPMTEDEKRADDEELERRTFVDFFGLDRLRLCRRIALEMMSLATTLSPDRPPARAKRRELRSRLDELASIQFELMQYRGTDAKEARVKLKNMDVAGVI